RDLALKQNSSRAAAPRRRLRSYRRFSACARRCETATCRPPSSHRHITAMLIIAFIYSGGLPICRLHRRLARHLDGYWAPTRRPRLRADVHPARRRSVDRLSDDRGAHPTLVGVVLGLISPVRSIPLRGIRLRSCRACSASCGAAVTTKDTHRLAIPLRKLRVAQREILPPVVRVQTALHPWVAYGVMPLFALAQRGCEPDGVPHQEARNP